MKLQTKKFLSLKTFFAGTLVVLGVFVGISTAHADTAVTVTGSIHNVSHAVITTAPIGSLVHDSVTIGTSTASTTPTGTVDFNLYPNTSCSGTSSLQSGVALVNGVAESATTTVTASGLSYKVHYNGDAQNIATDGSCQSLTATSAGLGITTALSSSTVQIGTSVYANATLANATANASGTVKYTVFNNDGCSINPQDGGTKVVTNAIVPSSNTIQFNSAGTFYWQVVYSGDTNNSAATSSCVGGLLTVLSGTSTPATGPGVIAGTLFNDLNRNHIQDAGEVGLSGRTIKLYKGAGWWWGFKKNKGFITTATTDANGHYSFTGLADGVYSVEEINAPGWRQITGDFRRIVIKNGSSKLDANFADIAKIKKGEEKHEDREKKEKKENHGKEVSKVAKEKSKGEKKDN
jgi:hypothetical protein